MQQGRPQKRGPRGANRQGQNPGRNGTGDGRGKRPDGSSSRGSSNQRPQNNQSGPGRSPQNRNQQQNARPKKLGLFDLKSQATETVDIPTSNRPFKGELKPNANAQVDAPLTRNVLFFETFGEAEASLKQIQDVRKPGEELSLVIHQEHVMEGTTLNAYGRLFCGEAWWIIHHRRVEEGWYANQKGSLAAPRAGS